MKKDTIIEALVVVILFWAILLAAMAVVEHRSRSAVSPHLIVPAPDQDVHKPD